MASGLAGLSTAAILRRLASEFEDLLTGHSDLSPDGWLPSR